MPVVAPATSSKEIVPLATVTPDWLRGQLDAMQAALFEKARAYRDANIRTAGSYEELKKFVEWVEQSPRLLRVESVRMEKLPGALVMKVYVMGLVRKPA